MMARKLLCVRYISHDDLQSNVFWYVDEENCQFLFTEIDGISPGKEVLEEEDEEKTKQRKAISKFHICSLLT